MLVKPHEQARGMNLVNCSPYINMESKTNVLLVHGAWADGSSWSKVIPLLDPKQFNVTAVQIAVDFARG
jgi:pimeloyl-ACP methyl ester carboxylesterase